MNAISLPKPQRPRRASDPHSLHQRLAHWNRKRLSPGFPDDDWRAVLAEEHEMKRCEAAFVEQSRTAILLRAAEAPDDPDAFVEWFYALKQSGPGQGDGLFPWLAEQADLEQMRWFVEQEAAGEAGFDDLVAMTQVKMPTQAKLELARNYWDEMGRGNAKGMHGPMLGALTVALELDPQIETTLWPSLALANTMAALATNRRYAYHSVGALGAIELTAPGRSEHVAAGLKRLGVSGKARHYFDLHAVLDVRHADAWLREVVRPLVAENPDTARAMAEGALMRLACGAQCFEVYRAHMWSAEAQRAGLA